MHAASVRDMCSWDTSVRKAFIHFLAANGISGNALERSKCEVFEAGSCRVQELSIYQLLEHSKVVGWAKGFGAGWRCAVVPRAGPFSSDYAVLRACLSPTVTLELGRALG